MWRSIGRAPAISTCATSSRRSTAGPATCRWWPTTTATGRPTSRCICRRRGRLVRAESVRPGARGARGCADTARLRRRRRCGPGGLPAVHRTLDRPRPARHLLWGPGRSAGAARTADGARARGRLHRRPADRRLGLPAVHGAVAGVRRTDGAVRRRDGCAGAGRLHRRRPDGHRGVSAVHGPVVRAQSAGDDVRAAQRDAGAGRLRRRRRRGCRGLRACDRCRWRSTRVADTQPGPGDSSGRRATSRRRAITTATAGPIWRSIGRRPGSGS